ncbi:MAG: hemerythrin domain-containing protein [Alicyclobacillus macrosporangiidus]|uniref:hemerythrin domain-containing protein n=1 Tax=Alicyclobacillus macrosporangiidus TaxID=392015 RepID=UPI0026ECB935|nr:hemerythrin domain-containing protein [Alicyclobacillus macrosporangiidus]MCL6597382.1 hemerythrin domain-containing protein [Alicyclobacillus macrosporangiidus]
MERLSLGFQEQKLTPVFRLGDSRLVQLSLKKGGVVDKHKTTHTLVFVVLTGHIRFTAGEASYTLRASEGVIVEPLQEHQVEALEDSVALLYLIPAPAATEAETAAPAEAALPVCAFTHSELLQQIDPALRSFVEDHIDLCKQLEQARLPFDRDRVQSVVDAVGRELAHHFVYEEEILFPRLAHHLGGPDVGPVPKLLKEHRMVRELHRECTGALSAWDEPAPSQGRDDIERVVLNKLRELATLLWNHIEKEDNHLFTMASRILTPEEKTAIAEEIARRDESHAR